MFAQFYPFTLGWSHYLVLMRIKNDQERRFYEIEAAKQQWTVRQLRRQYASSLYERLALSRDKEGVMRLATEGQEIVNPRDILKNPLVLEFLGMEEKAVYSESDLETVIIDKRIQPVPAGQGAPATETDRMGRGVRAGQDNNKRMMTMASQEAIT